MSQYGSVTGGKIAAPIAREIFKVAVQPALSQQLAVENLK
jgi:hypothetical protein